MKMGADKGRLADGSEEEKEAGMEDRIWGLSGKGKKRKLWGRGKWDIPHKSLQPPCL